MLFNSLIFLWFFILVYGLYLVLDHRWQNRMLLVASLWFYGSWDVRFLSLLIASIVLDYICGIRIHEAPTPGRKRAWLALSMAGNLGMLCFFKYYNFFVESGAAFLSWMGFEVHPSTLRIILPVGISFYTFQTMSYTIDIYRGKLKPTYDWVNFSLFVSYFPQLVAGPIERARNLLPQLEKSRTLNLYQIKEGIFLIAWGLFKKVIIADHSAKIVNSLYAQSGSLNTGEVLLALYAFSMQIYGDFSGYSDIARGVSKLMGVELMVNFRLPYFAVRPSDFWGRWHISLTTWVRDYLFVSLGANKHGNFRTHFNLLLTMFVIGLWHGAAWTFILWGLYFGAMQALHILIQPTLGRWVPVRNEFQRIFVLIGSMVLTYHMCVIGGIFFRSRNLAQIGEMFTGLFSGRFEFSSDFIQMSLKLIFICLPMWVLQVSQYRSNDLLIFMKWPNWARFAGVLACLFVIFYIYLFTADIRGGEEFIYFQF